MRRGRRVRLGRCAGASRSLLWALIPLTGWLSSASSFAYGQALPGRAPAGPAANAPRAGAPAASSANSDPQNPPLPADFEPPRKPPEVMSVIKELMTNDDEKNIEKELIREKFSNILRAGELNSKTRPVLQKGARYNVHRLTLKKYYLPNPEEEAAPKMIHELRDKLVADTNQAGRLMNAEDGRAARAFREFYMKEITDRASELLDGNFHVRLNAIILLSELTVQEGDPKKNQLDEAYVGAYEPLVRVLDDKDQPEAVKVQAVKGLARICAFGKPNSDVKYRIGQTLTNELKRKGTHFWYQMRLAEAIGTVDIALDRDRKPYLAQTLMESLVDPERHCVVRSEAARSLGRIPLEGDVNVPLIAFEVAQLALQMAEKYNADPNGIYWRDCFLKAYLAFKPRDAAGRDRLDGLITKAEKGSIGKHKAIVEGAYKVVVPLAAFVLNGTNAGKAIPGPATESLDGWLKKNIPSDLRVAPNLQPLTPRPAIQPTAAASTPPAG